MSDKENMKQNILAKELGIFFAMIHRVAKIMSPHVLRVKKNRLLEGSEGFISLSLEMNDIEINEEDVKKVHYFVQSYLGLQGLRFTGFLQGTFQFHWETNRDLILSICEEHDHFDDDFHSTAKLYEEELSLTLV